MYLLLLLLLLLSPTAAASYCCCLLLMPPAAAAAASCSAQMKEEVFQQVAQVDNRIKSEFTEEETSFVASNFELKTVRTTTSGVEWHVDPLANGWCSAAAATAAANATVATVQRVA